MRMRCEPRSEGKSRCALHSPDRGVEGKEKSTEYVVAAEDPLGRKEDHCRSTQCPRTLRGGLLERGRSPALGTVERASRLAKKKSVKKEKPFPRSDLRIDDFEASATRWEGGVGKSPSAAPGRDGGTATVARLLAKGKKLL